MIGGMTTRHTYSIRGYREGDEVAINTLFNEVFATDERYRTLEEWYWKFKKNPSKAKEVSDYATLVIYNGKIVGQYAIWYGNFKYKDEIIKTGQPVDNFVHPAYRSSFRAQMEMFEKQNEVAIQEDVKFGFGFPNEAAYFIGKKLLGYKDIGNLTTLSIRLNVAFSIKRRLSFLPHPLVTVLGYLVSWIIKLRISSIEDVSSLVVEEIKSFDAAFDTFWKEVSLNYPLVMVKDSTYMNWRYRDKPDENYRVYIARTEDQIKGCIVVKIAEDTMYYPGAHVGYIMEFLSLQETGIPELLIKTALHFFASAGVDFCVAVLFPEDFHYGCLLAAGFSSKKNLPIHKMVYKIYAREKIDENFITNPQKWHVSLGDFDTL